MKVHQGDRVQILAGKDRGKKGKVTEVFPKGGRIIVEGLNLRVKHLRPRKEREKGERIQWSAPLPASRVMVECPKCTKSTRIGYRIIDGKKHRICRKCKEMING